MTKLKYTYTDCLHDMHLYAAKIHMSILSHVNREREKKHLIHRYIYMSKLFISKKNTMEMRLVNNLDAHIDLIC